MAEARRRAQSVLDFTEVDLLFTIGGFAEGDDADFMIVLRMGDGDRDAGKQAKCDEALLAIGEPVIFIRERCPLKDARSVDEVESVSLEVERTLPLRPRELHALIVYTERSGVNCPRFSGLTFELSGALRQNA